MNGRCGRHIALVGEVTACRHLANEQRLSPRATSSINLASDNKHYATEHQQTHR